MERSVTLFLATLYSAIWCYYAFSSTFAGVALSVPVQLAGWLSSILFLFCARPRSRSEPSPDLGVVISGCDTGFGNMLANALSAEGYRVFAGCLTPGGVESFKALPNVDAFCVH